MKKLTDFIHESLLEGKACPGCGTFKKENEEEEQEKVKESIKDEKSFRNYAENKFKVVFGDNLDKKKMNNTIDGLLSDNKELVDKGDWGELVGMLNKSFGA